MEKDSIDRLREWDDSITRPYPSFAEHVRALIADNLTEKDIADLVNDAVEKGNKTISNAAIGSWAADGAPGSNFYEAIFKALGYSFMERRFSECVRIAGFPPADAHADIEAIRTVDKLREYLLRASNQVGTAALITFFGMKQNSNFGRFVVEQKGVNTDTLGIILHNLPNLPYHLDGTILSVTTPRVIVARVLSKCRLRDGGTKDRYVIEHLGLTGDDSRFWHWFESLADRETEPTETKSRSSFTKNPERLEKLCKALTRRRVELGIAPVMPAFLVKKDENVGSVVQPVKSDSTPLVKTPEVPSPGSDDHIKMLEEQVRSLRKFCEELSARITDFEKGRSVRTQEAIPFVSPFSLERFQKHDAPVDEHRLAHTILLVRSVIEELGFYAMIGDESARTRVRETLDDLLLTELFGAIEAMSHQYPEGVLKLLIERRRSFSREINQKK